MLGSIYWAWSIAHRLLDQCNLGGMGFVWKLLGLINCTSPGSSKLCIWWFKMIVPSGPNPFTDNDLSFKANNWSFYVYGTLLSDFGFNAFLRNFTMIVSIWIDNSPQIFFLSSSSPFSSFFFFFLCFFYYKLVPISVKRRHSPLLLWVFCSLGQTRTSIPSVSICCNVKDHK